MPVAELNYSEFEAGLEKTKETEQEWQNSQGKTEAELKPDGDRNKEGTFKEQRGTGQSQMQNRMWKRQRTKA